MINETAWVIVGPNDGPQLWTVASSKVGSWRSLINPSRIKERINEYREHGYRCVQVRIEEVTEPDEREVCETREKLNKMTGEELAKQSWAEVRRVLSERYGEPTMSDNNSDAMRERLTDDYTLEQKAMMYTAGHDLSEFYSAVAYSGYSHAIDKLNEVVTKFAQQEVAAALAAERAATRERLERIAGEWPFERIDNRIHEWLEELNAR